MDASLLRSTLAASDAAPDVPGKSANAAWQMEMERAQLGSWFKPFVPDQPALPGNTRGAGTAALAAPALRLPAVSRVVEHVQEFVATPYDAAPATHGGGSIMPGEGTEPVEALAGTMRRQVYSSSAMRGEQAGAVEQGAASPSAGFAEPMVTVDEANTAVHGLAAGPGQNVGVARGSVPEPVVNSRATPVASVVAVLPQLSAAVLAENRIFLGGTDYGGPKSEVDLPVLDVGGEGVDASHTLNDTPSASARRALSSASADGTPVRLHVQWQGQTAHIWLGMDGGAAQIASQIQIVVAELRRHFSALGQRIGRGVCNGSLVFDCQCGNAAVGESRFAAQFDAQASMQSQLQRNVNSNSVSWPVSHFQEDI